MFDVLWRKEWFPRLRSNTSLKNSISNQKNLIDELALKFGILHSNHWKKVTNAMIIKNGGKVSFNSFAF